MEMTPAALLLIISGSCIVGIIILIKMDEIKKRKKEE